MRQSAEPYLTLLNGVTLMSIGVLLNNVQRHYGMNFPSCVPGLVTSPVRLIFGSLKDVPKRFANNGDDQGISDFQPFSRTSLKWKSRGCPTKNSLANVAPLQVCRYLTNNDSRFIACWVT